MLEDLVIYCADVGSIAKNFGWARVDRFGDDLEEGTEIKDLRKRLSTDLAAGSPVAIGFECPLWVPIPVEGLELGKARVGEAGPGRRARPWSAAAGGGSLVAGLVQVPWLLEQSRASVPRDLSATTDWAVFINGEAPLFVWEAMVTDTAKGKSHADDARIGALAFQAALPDPRPRDACHPDGPVYSLAGAALLRSGLSKDLEDLQRPCLVIRAE